MGLHFSKRRALANGLSSSGSGAGAFAIPNFIRFLLFEYGFNGCLLILGAVVLNTCVCACLFRPIDFWKKSKKYDKRPKSNGDDKSRFDKFLCNRSKTVAIEHNHDTMHSSTGNLDRHQNSFLLKQNMKYSSQPTLILHNRNVKEKLNPTIYTSLESLCIMTLPESNGVKQKSSICSILDWALLKNPLYLIINTSIWFGIFGHNAVFNCLPSLCVEFGMSDTDAALVVSIVGISDLVGRILGGWLADLKYFKRRTVFQISMLLFGACMFITPHVTSFIGMCIMSVLVGVTTGGYIGTQVSVLADTFGIERLSSSLGFTFFCASLALLASPFLSGKYTEL